MIKIKIKKFVRRLRMIFEQRIVFTVSWSPAAKSRTPIDVT